MQGAKCIFARMTWIAPSFTFPPISWWMRAVRSGELVIDSQAPFKKMTCRNRYHISGPNNPILLTVPILHGRDQRGALSDMYIFNAERWQVRHWRTLESVYGRTPFFAHYAPYLGTLFEQRYEKLVDFNRTSIQVVNQFLNKAIRISESGMEMAAETHTGPEEQTRQLDLPRYHQIFADRIGYQDDLSILDLLFSEGPATISLLKM